MLVIAVSTWGSHPLLYARISCAGTRGAIPLMIFQPVLREHSKLKRQRLNKHNLRQHSGTRVKSCKPHGNLSACTAMIELRQAITLLSHVSPMHLTLLSGSATASVQRK